MKPILVLALAMVAAAEPHRVNLDPKATEVHWTLGSLLHTVHGTFQLKSADLWVDPESGKAGGKLIVDAKSGESGSSARDGRMHKSILESEKYPDITFVPDRVEGAVNLQGDSTVKLHGAFTIHGGTHEMTMAVKSHGEQGKLTSTITFAVPYLAWGFKNPSTLFLKVNDTVDVEIRAAGSVQ
ncbi:MAG: YceI family protein [Bryobacteraceae bacterium]